LPRGARIMQAWGGRAPAPEDTERDCHFRALPFSLLWAPFASQLYEIVKPVAGQ